MFGKILSSGKFILIGFVVVTFILHSCKNDKAAMFNPTTKTTEVNCDTVNNIKYSGAIDQIINTNCAIPTCHVPGGSGSGDFTTYSGVMEKVNSGAFEYRIFYAKSDKMPPSNSLSDCDLKKIRIWLDAGAPN